MMAGKGDLVGLPVVRNREILLYSTVEASVPMEVDPAVGLSLPGALESESREGSAS